jgi:hypothetical protein
MVRRGKDKLGLLDQKNNNEKINKIDIVKSYGLTLEDIVNGNTSLIKNKTPHGLFKNNYSSIKNKTLGKYVISEEEEDLLARVSESQTALKSGIESLRTRLGLVSVKPPDLASDTKPESKIDLTINDSKILVVITEAPNTNIIKWNSKVYQSYGSVKKMIATGYHNPEVWRSILFQLIYSCAILQQNNIYFDNFSLENNVYIKDVQTDGTGKSCWVYKINNIDYYVPNYGYLLVIDSNFADVKDYKTTDPIKYKIYGDIFNNINSGLTNFSKLIKDKLLNILDNTGNSFVHENGNQLDDVIKTLISNIHSSCISKDKIVDLIPSHFKEYVHNKVGTLLTKFEKENFSIFNKPTYVDGSLMVRQKRFDEYEWVIYLGADGNKKKILSRDRSKDKESLIEESVFPATLFSYFEKVLPDEINIIETYCF